MGVEVAWDSSVESTIHYTVGDPWSLEDLNQAREQAYQMIEDVEGLVHVMVDFWQMKRMPQVDLSFGKQFSNPHPRIQCVVMVGMWKIIERLFGMYKMIHGKGERVQFADSIDEARAILIEQTTRPV